MYYYNTPEPWRLVGNLGFSLTSYSYYNKLTASICLHNQIGLVFVWPHLSQACLGKFSEASALT